MQEMWVRSLGWDDPLEDERQSTPVILPGESHGQRNLVKVKVAQSCLTLCDQLDYIVHGILQARILEWIAFPFFRGSSQPRSPALQADSLPAEPQESQRVRYDLSD